MASPSQLRERILRRWLASNRITLTTVLVSLCVSWATLMSIQYMNYTSSIMSVFRYADIESLQLENIYGKLRINGTYSVSINKAVHVQEDCLAAVQGNPAAWARLRSPSYQFAFPVTQTSDYVNWQTACDAFRYRFGYLDYKVSNEELELPIAFSLIVYDNGIQVERLLHAIYRHHNVYCLHIDAKASNVFRQAMESIASCFHNVFIASKCQAVYWGMMSVVDAEMSCMRDLVHYKHWKYFINLTGKDFPIRTNKELVRILQVFNGSNDISGNRSE